MIKKLLVAAAFAFVLAPAQAQCMPAEINGTGTQAVVEFNAAGAAIGWWCPDRFRPKLTLYAVRWEALTPALHAELTALWRAADKSAAIERMREAHVDTPLASPLLFEVWWPARARLLATKPPTPEWVVGADGATYQWVDGRLVADPQRVTPGAPCDCAKDERRVFADQQLYCRINEARFARCVPRAR